MRLWIDARWWWWVAVAAGNESEKKEREARGKVEMTWRTRGVSVDGHVERQVLAQRCSSAERALSWAHVLATEASAGPSRHVRMWFWIMSGWTAEMVVAPPVSTVVAVFVLPRVRAIVYIVLLKVLI